MSRFFKLTPELAEILRDNLTLSEWKLWSYFATLDPFGDQYVEIPDLDQILEITGISRRTFFRALSKFNDLELFDFKYKKGYIKNLQTSSSNTEDLESYDRPSVTDGAESVTDGTNLDMDDTNLDMDDTKNVTDDTDTLYTEIQTDQTLSEGRKKEKTAGNEQKGLSLQTPIIGQQKGKNSGQESETSALDKYSERGAAGITATHQNVQQRAFNWLPDGPWNIDGKLDPNFRDFVANKWVAEYGKDLHTQRANVLAHFKKDPANLPIRWEQYRNEYLDRIGNAQIRLNNGLEIDPTTKERLLTNHRALTAELPPEMSLIAAPPLPPVSIPLPQGAVSAPIAGSSPTPIAALTGQNSEKPQNPKPEAPANTSQQPPELIAPANAPKAPPEPIALELTPSNITPQRPATVEITAPEGAENPQAYRLFKRPEPKPVDEEAAAQFVEKVKAQIAEIKARQEQQKQQKAKRRLPFMTPEPLVEVEPMAPTSEPLAEAEPMAPAPEPLAEAEPMAPASEPLVEVEAPEIPTAKHIPTHQEMVDKVQRFLKGFGGTSTRTGNEKIVRAEVIEDYREAERLEKIARKQNFLKQLNEMIKHPAFREEVERAVRNHEGYEILYTENGVPYEVIFAF